MTVLPESKDFVVTYRGDVVENRHGVHAAVVDAAGKLLYAIGDPSRITLARSAAKPAQALAILETGAFEKFGFEEADLALICSSHSGEDIHIERVLTMLSKIQAEEKDLRCGGHTSLSEEVNRTWIKNDYTPTAVCNNCSAKHAGMMAGALALGVDTVDYHLADHPIQLRVMRAVEQLCGLEPSKVLWGIDGCNAPAPAIPLDRLAWSYARLSAAADSLDTEVPQLSQLAALARVYHACVRYPEMVAGDGRFCTVLMRAYQGALLGKVGADGCYGIGIRASEATRRLGAGGAVGIAVKIEDGNTDILYKVVVEMLKELGVGNPDTWRELAPFHDLELRNTMGVGTGRVSFPFKIRRI
ncbi:L-asparaginase [Fusarium oxysporum f. sp. conglutinans race 2 54008]|nr:hypothetical protein FOXB_07808 [Fusarium oxysporum f. sp. conglutinans Fo5176]EXL65689.1 L-asparaginase [Fusarium oxysporum f. sp. conglutinans race 2 54008]KAG7001552.1 hypothetical protein FocnCong_v011252 [Fusarium oxysporum f. sp. conglutinans]KAI8396565.1 hypothetical protein FOFC_21113 [Fusarium oxysporum]